MRKSQKIILIWILVICLFIAGGSIFGGIKIQRKEKIQIFDPVFAISQIESIEGKMYSSPRDMGFFLDIIGQAQKNLYLEIYEFTEQTIRDLFDTLLQNGVEIKIIMEDQKYSQFKNTFREVRDLFSGYDNFEIKNDRQMKTNYVHAKFFLIDTGFLIQTSNMTKSTFTTNREYFFYSEHSGIWHSLYTIFDKDRNGETIKTQDIHPNLLVCPINCRSVLEYLIESAKESIIIENQYIEDPRLLELIEEKIEILDKGAIQINLPDTEQNQTLQKKRGKSIISLIKKPYIHAKMMLIDHQILYLGSINFSTNSMDNNREIGILLTDPILIKQFLSVFAKK